VMEQANDALKDFYNLPPSISESFNITDIYNVLNSVPGIVDVVDVKIEHKVGGNYSTTSFVISEHTTPDGRSILFPEDHLWEIKYPNVDIKGTIK